jgi:tRNA threonylcarbamoyladenosine modification (KEOPS) complex  Pcc1 subunit
MRALNYVELDMSSSSRTSVYSMSILPEMKSSPRSRSRIQRGLSL